jgi:hypothetical protein
MKSFLESIANKSQIKISADDVTDAFDLDKKLVVNGLESPHQEVQKAAIGHKNFGSDSDHFFSALKSPHQEVVAAAKARSQR